MRCQWHVCYGSVLSIIIIVHIKCMCVMFPNVSMGMGEWKCENEYDDVNSLSW